MWGGWVLLCRETGGPRTWPSGAVTVHATRAEAMACMEQARGMENTTTAYVVLFGAERKV